jgi:hypothetical protein
MVSRVGKNPGFFAKTWQAGFSGFITGFSRVFKFLLAIVFRQEKMLFSTFKF